MDDRLLRQYVRVYKEKHDLYAKERAQAIREGREMAMLDEHDNVIVVTNMSEDEFRNFLITGDKDPRMTENIAKTRHPEGNYVSTMFLGSPLEPGKWYETYRKKDGEMIRNATRKEALEVHETLAKSL